MSRIKFIYFNTLISKVFKYISKQKCIALNIQIMILTKIFYFKCFPYFSNMLIVYFLNLIRCKKLLYAVLYFHQIFPSYQYINKIKYLFLTSEKKLLRSPLQNLYKVGKFLFYSFVNLVHDFLHSLHL